MEPQDSRGRGRARGSPTTTTAASEESLSRGTSEMKLESQPAGGQRPSEGGPPRPRFVSNEDVVTRPEGAINKRGGGAGGEPVTLVANYFRLERKKNWFLYQHHVTFTPEEELSTREKKKLLKNYDDTNENSIGAYLFDGHLLYAPRNLVPHGTPNWTFDSELKRSETVTLTFKISIAFTKELASTARECMQFYNIIMRKCLGNLSLEQIGRYFYDKMNGIPIPQHHLEIWPGLETSIRHHETDVMLCVDVTHRVLRQDTAYELINNLRSSYGDGWQAKANEELSGRYVMTTYNKIVYQIDKIAVGKNAESEFQTKNGPITYEAYYQQRYNIKIGVPKCPLLLVRRSRADIRRGNTSDILLVPELCKMTGLTEDMRANFNLMRDLSSFMHMIPDTRVNKISKFMASIQAKPELKQELIKWNVRFNANLVNVPGHILPREQLIFGREQFETVSDRADWSMAFRNKPLHTPVDLAKWALILPNRSQHEVQNFVNAMYKVGTPLGLNVDYPQRFQVQDINEEAYLEQIVRCMGATPGLIMVILPNNRLPLYAAIKKSCCVDYGVPSQCIVARTLEGKKGLFSIATKVVIQIVAKLRGIPWTMNIPIKRVMFVGINVYHGATRAGPGRTSWGATVATIDATYGRYHSRVEAHSDIGGFTTNIIKNIKLSLREFEKTNKGLPDRIAIYRDGVGEGQLQEVFDVEVAGIKNTLDEIYLKRKESAPKFLFVVVSKRIRTKFFASGERGYENPMFGTVVDDVVTLPHQYDFYLISQMARQGTVGPTSYNVLNDSFGLDPGKVQRLTYKLTHAYYNWSGTIAIPAICQYAHKLAFLTATATGGPPNESLCNNLFYL